MINSQLPVLYSFRRCPYAIRARLAIWKSGVAVELREILLKDKPSEMLDISAKGTVPVLQLVDGGVLDESIDVFHWALQQNDPDSWLAINFDELAQLVAANDGEFKYWLDRYKYWVGYPEHSEQYYRAKAEEFIALLEQRLSVNRYLMGDNISAADIAVLPFVRQFALVNKHWFDQAEYPQVQTWLGEFLASSLFLSVMEKYIPWQQGQEKLIFSHEGL